MSCAKSCYELLVPCCVSIRLNNIGLAANTAYSVVFNKIGSDTYYSKTINTDSGGALLIDKNDFPKGYFAVDGFYIRVTISAVSEAICSQSDLITICGIQYRCLQIKTTNEKIENEIYDFNNVQILS